MLDNYDMWEFNERKKEAWLRTRPVCEHCGHPIQEDSLFDVYGELYHPACAMELFSKDAEEYVYEA